MNLNTSLSEQFANHKDLIIDAVFYLLCSLLVAMVACYFIFSHNISARIKDINDLSAKLSVYASVQQKEAENRVIYYKKKIDTYSQVISGHRISSNLFDFLNDNTLEGVSFSAVNVSEVQRSFNLLGEAKDTERLSSQIRVFESRKDYVKSINVLNSQVSPTGKVTFTLSLTLGSDIFTNPKPSLVPQESENTTGSVNGENSAP